MTYTQIVKKVVDDEEVYYVGKYLEIPEARTNADTYSELEKRMKEVLELSIECRIKNGDEIPEPIEEDSY